ncbi:hypothetical protein ACFVJI_23360 [Streptomyces sp. NPDC127584]|uniref:hypothetical protein n=1 Tax=Streptomyces sp. NPDC127584 TaxID=3345403 RepID=UPI00362BDEEB
MLEQALAALAAAGGAAVVQAAGTDAWTGLRQAVARWFARGDDGREQLTLERLDQTSAALREASEDAAELRIRLETAWQTRIEALLDGMDEAERGRAAEQLLGLLARHAPGSVVSAGDGGVSVGGNVTISAPHGVAGWQVGTVHVNPPPPGSPQG